MLNKIREAATPLDFEVLGAASNADYDRLLKCLEKDPSAAFIRYEAGLLAEHIMTSSSEDKDAIRKTMDVLLSFMTQEEAQAPIYTTMREEISPYSREKQIVNVIDTHSNNLAHMMVYYDRPEILECLVQNNLDLGSMFDQVNSGGANPIALALERGQGVLAIAMEASARRQSDVVLSMIYSETKQRLMKQISIQQAEIDALKKACCRMPQTETIATCSSYPDECVRFTLNDSHTRE